MILSQKNHFGTGITNEKPLKMTGAHHAAKNGLRERMATRVLRVKRAATAIGGMQIS
jgi:hypothetical protein